MADIFADDFKLENEENKPPEVNPFSFSNFVSGKTTNDHDGSTSTSKCERDVPPVAEDDDDKENPYSFQNFNSTGVNRPVSKKLQIIDDDPSTVPSPSSFPTSTKERRSSSDWEDISGSPKEDSTTTTDSEEDVQLVRIEELIKENALLRSDLSKVREEFLEYRRTANKRVTCLQKELEKVRKKEAEETQDLESAVRMVEENLQKTTERAIKAESTVSRLREEMNSLKTENVAKSVYDTLLLEHNQLLHTIQDKSKSAAQLMRTAADKTEPHVKQLQSGIASLRFFAQQFDDICKITELPVQNDSPDDVT